MVTGAGTRDPGDRHRYNLLPEIARCMGPDTSRNDTLWCGRAVTELDEAVLHSLKRARVLIVDHHTADSQLVRHLDREREAGRPVPVDRSRLLTPTAGSTTELFHMTFPPPDFDETPDFSYQEPARDETPGGAAPVERRPFTPTAPENGAHRQRSA